MELLVNIPCLELVPLYVEAGHADIVLIRFQASSMFLSVRLNSIGEQISTLRICLCGSRQTLSWRQLSLISHCCVLNCQT